MVNSAVGVVGKGYAIPSLNPEGGRFGLPADFLIDCDGKVLAAKYGKHAYDQWSVDELLLLARSPQARRAADVASACMDRKSPG